jgi:putative selenate reductase
MAELTPYPLAALAGRMFRELETRGAIFDLPHHRFFLGHPELDFSVRFQGHTAAAPLGPAAGPHTQMAQNIVLSWLGGARIMELKTVQILDELELPRPCIDMRTIGFNAEWSQELKLEQSLDEYVKAAMLIHMLQHSGKLDLEPSFDRVVYDLSVGYDLEGIRQPRVQKFIRGMMDARDTVERLRSQLPATLGSLRDLDFPTRLADTVTLSTFHGCPPEEIESIIESLMQELGLHCIIKFNPMLLGAERARELLHQRLGYADIKIPDSAFERDATWPQAVEIVERLEEKAAQLGLGLGAKFTNTLIVENNQGFLPDSESEVYLSGPPLHVLAMHLVRRFRRTFGDRLPISFSAGVDRFNYADSVAVGLVPITVCSDLLKKGGYGRMSAYHGSLAARMKSVQAASIDEYIIRAYDQGDAALESLGGDLPDPTRRECRDALIAGADLRPAAGEYFERWVSATKILNTERYVDSLLDEPRYRSERNNAMPPKIGRHLELFDCLTCDICVPVCPNDANFTFRIEAAEIPITKLRKIDGGWEQFEEGALALEERHQIGNLADFCNDCGNCDVFCPEDGGPYVMKPRFFRRRSDWLTASDLDGFQLERRGGREIVHGRFQGNDYVLEVDEERRIFSGADFRVELVETEAGSHAVGDGPEEIDLTYCLIMDALRRSMFDTSQVNYVNSLQAVASEES